MITTLNLLEGSRRSVSPLAHREVSSSQRLAQFLDQSVFHSSAEGPVGEALAQTSNLAEALGRLSDSRRLALEASLGTAGLAELSSLGSEADAGLFAEALFGFAQRQELAGRLDMASGLYAWLAQDSNLTEVSSMPSLRRRAQTQLDAILGRGATGPRLEFLMRRFAHEATEPTTLFAMTAAGALYRITRLATLSRLAASPSSTFLTRGWGAQALSGLAGFAVEAPAFTLSGRLAGEALGRRQDWSGPALGRDVASSFLVLGGLKLAGWASGSVYRGLANPVGAVRERPLQILFQQGGMLTGILGGHWAEERLGLRPHVPGATTLVDSLALLLQFNVAGNLTRHAFGERVAAWERGLEVQTEILAQENIGRRPTASHPFGMGPVLTPVVAGPAHPEFGRRPVEDLLRGSQVLMSKMDEGGFGRGSDGASPGRGGKGPNVETEVNTARLDRDLSNFFLTAGDNFEVGLRTFIENQPIATAVARLERGNNDFGRIFMANKKFTEIFGYTEREAGEHNITHYFNTLSLPFIAARIWGIVRGGVFNPTNMKFRHRDGSWIDIVGSGVIKDVAGHSIAFGFYEPRTESSRENRTQAEMISRLTQSNREQPLRSHEGVLEIGSISELSAQLTRPDSGLLQQIVNQDLRVRITNMPWVHNPEGYAEALLRYVNLQDRKLNFRSGSRVVIEFPANDSRTRTLITMVKFSDTFKVLGQEDTAMSSSGTAADVPLLPIRTIAPAASGSGNGVESTTASNGRSLESLTRLQQELGAVLTQESDRLAREDVVLTLRGPFEANFVQETLPSLPNELQAAVQGRIAIPLGRRVTVLIPTERGELRLVYKKVLLKFEQVE